MILVRLGFVLFFILSQNVLTNCGENILLYGRYNFNHPPSVEDYNPIRINVHYNDEESAEVKAVPDLNNFSSEPQLISQPVEELLPPAAPTSITTTTDSVTEQNDINVKPKGRAFNEQKIAVPVIYDRGDEEDKIYKDIKPKPEQQSQVIREGQPYRQQKQLSFKEKESEMYYQEPKINDLQTSTGAVSSMKKGKNRQRDPVVPILESENFLYAYRGNYRYGYESGDGTKAFGKGELKTFSDNSTGEAVEGSFSYKDKEGNNFSLTYTADENGYRPVGAHLPTPPPLPPAIARALRYLATKTIPETITEKL